MLFIESEVVELKAEIVGDICKEVIAFANTKGGTLYIGVRNDGSIVGVENADRVTLQLNNMIRDSIKPDVTMFVHYNTQRIADKDKPGNSQSNPETHGCGRPDLSGRKRQKNKVQKKVNAIVEGSCA